LHPEDEWILSWKLENFNVEDSSTLFDDAWLRKNTLAARDDMIILAAIFDDLAKKRS
jgi:hypothetical protein